MPYLKQQKIKGNFLEFWNENWRQKSVSIVKSIMRSCWESCVLSNKIFKFGHFLMTAHLTNGEKLKYFEERRRKHSCLCLSIKGGEWICVITWIAILLGSLRHQSIEAQSCSVKQEQARVSSKFYLILFHQRSKQLKQSELAMWPTLFVGCKHLFELALTNRQHMIYALAENIPRQQIGCPATCSHIAVLKHFAIALTISALNPNTKYLCFNT